MAVDLTRRGFLKGLAGVAVIAVLPRAAYTPAPSVAAAVVPATEAVPPPGITYNWVRTSLLGEPDMENLEGRINNGWTFVRPSAHPEMQTEDAAIAFEHGGLILMQCSTAEVEARRAAEHKAKMDRLLGRMAG